MKDALRVRGCVYQQYKSRIKRKRHKEDVRLSERHKRVIPGK